MRTLRVRFAAMLATAAVVPLLTYGVVSLYSLREGTRRTVTDGNLNVARQVGEQIRRYISTNLQILHALAADLDNAGLTRRSAGPDPQELRPALSRVQGTDGLRRGAAARLRPAASARRR